MKLKGKVAIVTGGSRGIGRAIVLDFIKEGARVVFLYKENLRAANKLVKEAKCKGKEVLALKTDISDFEKVDEAINQIIKKFKKIDIVVNNAGISTKGNLLINMQKEDWDKDIHTNLRGVFNVTKLAIPALIKQRRGTIINIASIGAVKPVVGFSSYITSKSSIVGFTKVIAIELARYGITVNAISPGLIETDMLNSSFPSKIKEDIIRAIPIGRVGNPKEVAKLVTFLSSDDARYITGAVVNIDGGLCLR